MKSPLKKYISYQNESLEFIYRLLRLDEDGLYALLRMWIEQELLPQDNRHYTEIKAIRAERRRYEIMEGRKRKLLRYQQLRDNGYSMTLTAEKMKMPTDRMEIFFGHEIDRLHEEGLSDREAAQILRMSVKYYQKLSQRVAQRRQQKIAAAKKRKTDNKAYAERHIAGIRQDLESGISRYLIFDIEASQHPDEIIEISMMDFHGNIIFDQLVKPSCGIDRRISKLTGITNEMVRNQPDIHTIMPIIQEKTRGCVLLSWGSDYDAVLWKKSGEMTGFQLDCELGCAQKIHMGMIDADHQIALGTAAGVSHQSHRALDDCRLVRKILLKDLGWEA